MEGNSDKFQFNPLVQVTKVSYDGIIEDTDATLFNWPKGKSIYDAHPFFEMLKTIEGAPDILDQALNFPCIHIEEGSHERICDLTIIPNPNHITIFLYDYTQKYQDLNLIAQQKNESILLARALELKNQYLVEKEEFKNSFISNINHEIRTPLTSILGFVEVLEKTPLTFEQEELTRIIKRESHHLNTLIDDMLDISKIESGLVKIVQERFSFKELMDGFKESYTKLAKEKNIAFETNIDDNIQEHLIGDRTRIFQILNNILNNAFKFTEEGKVTFTVLKNYQRTNKLSLTFKIEDSGIGISEEHIPQIFERFSRFSTSSNTPGTGLGLSIVKGLVDMLKGEIKVTSTPNKGSVFSIKLPFKFEVLKKGALPPKKKKYTLPDTKQKFRILVVEDEEVTQYLIMKILISQNNYFVDIAINAKQAINYIEKRRYDLVLMDLNLPQKTDGFKITQMIRNNYGDVFISSIPIIGFSGKSDDNARDKCIRAGMDDFISKPFEQEEFLYKIVKQIAKKAAV